MRIERVTNSKSEYRNTKQIQISNVQMIEEPHSPDEPGSSTRLVDKLKSSRYGECTHYDASNVVLELVSPRSCFDHSNLDN
jgi:hypothetical protein